MSESVVWMNVDLEGEVVVRYGILYRQSTRDFWRPLLGRDGAPLVFGDQQLARWYAESGGNEDLRGALTKTTQVNVMTNEHYEVRVTYVEGEVERER